LLNVETGRSLVAENDLSHPRSLTFGTETEKMTFVEERETWCRKRPFTSEIAHIRHFRTETENFAASPGDDVPSTRWRS